MYLSRPRQCLPIAYVIYHKRKTALSNAMQIVPIYHFHCSGNQRSATIDLTCDENETGIRSSAAAPVASDNSMMHGQQLVDGGSAQSLESLERHFMSLVQDMTSTLSQLQHSSSRTITAAAAASTSHRVTQTNNVSTSVDCNSVAFMFRAHFSSPASSSTQPTQVSITVSASRQHVHAGAACTSLPGRVVRTITPRILGESVRSTFASDWQRDQSRIHYINSLSAVSVSTTLPRQHAVLQTLRSISPSVSHASLSSVGSQSPFVPVSAVTSSAVRVGFTPQSGGTFTFWPSSISGVQMPRQSSTYAYPGTVCSVQAQQPLLAQNYNAFCPPQQHPLQFVLPQVATTAAQRTFNISPVCTAYGVNLTSCHFTQPSHLVTTVPSQYQLFTLSVTSASSTQPQMQVSRPAQYSAIAALSQMQVSGHAAQLLQPTSVNIALTTGAAGGHLVAGTECTATSVSPSYAVTATDEFVDMESIAAELIPPIVIAPVGSTDECGGPAEYEAGIGITVKQEPALSVRKSSSRQQHELICIDDDERGSLAVPTDGTSPEFTISQEPNTDDASFDFDQVLPTLLSDDIPAINIVPDDISDSAVETDKLHTTVLSENTTLFPLLNSDAADVEPVTASCITSDGVFPTVLPLTDAPVRVDTDGISFATSVESTVINPTSCGFVYSLENAAERNSLIRNSVYTVHHLPQSHVNNSLASGPVLAHYLQEELSRPVSYSVPAQPVITTPVSVPVLLTVLPSVCSVPTSVPSQLAPVNSTPLITLATTQASGVVRTCDVTAMATQLVSGLRSDAMRRRAKSAAKVAVQPQSSESVESDSVGTRKRHSGKQITSLPAKISKCTPAILSRSRSQHQQTAKEPAHTSVSTTSGISDGAVGSNITLSEWSRESLSQCVSSISSTCSASTILTTKGARSQTSLPAIGELPTVTSVTSQKSISASSNGPRTKTNKYAGETVVYHLNEDGSIEIRIQKGSISETSSSRRKQALQSDGVSGGFDAIVELGSSASQSWCSKTFVSDMGKYFNKLKVVRLSGNDSATSNKSLHVPELDRVVRTISPRNQRASSDADDVEPDSDSEDMLSLVASSVESADEVSDRQLAADDKGEDSSGLKIADVYSLNADSFSDLNDHVISSISSDTPREAQDKETLQQSYVDARDDVPEVAVNISVNSDGTKDHYLQDSRTDTITVSKTCQRVNNIDNSSLSTECHVVPTCSNTSFDEGHKDNADVEHEASPIDNSGDTSLFEISIDNDKDTDSEATLSLSIASPESTAEPLLNLVDAESNSQHAVAVEQHALLPSDGEIHSAIPLSSPDDEDDESLELPRSEDCRLSALEGYISPVITQPRAERYESATDMSVVLNEDEGGSQKFIAKMSSNNGSDFERQESHITSCPRQNDVSTEKGEVTFTSINMDRSNDDEDMRSELCISDGVESSLSSHVVSTVDKICTSSDLLTRPNIKNIDHNSGSSSGCDETAITDIQHPQSSAEDRLHENMTGEMKLTSAVLMPETKNISSFTCNVNKCNDVISTEPVTSPPELSISVSDISDVEPDDSCSETAGRLEMQSVSGPVLTTEESEAATGRGYSSLHDTEPVSPPLAEGAHDTGEHVSQAMTAAPLTKNSQSLELELTCESDHSSALRIGPLLHVPSNLESKAVPNYNNGISTESFSSIPLVDAPARSESSTRPDKVTDADTVTQVVEAACDNCDNNACICDVEPDDGSAARTFHSGREIEKLSGEIRPRDNSVVDMEPVSEQPCDSDMDFSDVEPIDHELRNAKSASATKYNVVDKQSVCPLPESPVTSSRSQNSACLPVLATEKSVFLARYSDNNLSDTCSVSPVQEPTPSVASNICESEHDKSSCSLKVACLPSPASAAKYTSHGTSAVKSALSVFVKSLLDVSPVSPKWLSETVSAQYGTSELRDKCTRSDVHRGRGYAFLKHGLSTVGTHSGVQHLNESHQACSRPVPTTKVPKRITLADYRNRKNASQVDLSDKNCQQVEANRAVATCETNSKVSSASAAESHSLYSSAVTSNSDGSLSVDNPVQECSDGSRSQNTDLSNSISTSCDMQKTAVPPKQVIGSYVADIVVSDCTESARPSDCGAILSPSSAVVGMETESSESEFKITGGQQKAEILQSSVANLSQINLNSSQPSTITTFSEPVTVPVDSSVGIKTLSGLVHMPDSQISPSSAVVGMETESSESKFKITGEQQKAEILQSSIADLSEINLNSSQPSTITTFSEPVTVPVDSSVGIKTLSGLVHIPDSQISPSAVNAEKALESHHAQNLFDSSAVVSTKDNPAELHTKECSSQGNGSVLTKDGKQEKKMKLKSGHMKAATMWQDSMRSWVNMDVSKHTDVIVPKYTLSNDYFVMRQNTSQLMKYVFNLASHTKVSLKDSISSLLKDTENLLHEELVYADVATQLDNMEAKLLIEKQRHMTDILCSVEAQLRDLSMELYGMPDAEAELSCYEKADWSTESDLHYNILLLTRHMLYKEMSSLRCYHNSRLVYRLPDELCLDVERDQFVSVEGCLLFLEYSILSLSECRQLFALKVEIEEAQYSLVQVNSDYRGSAQANRLGSLHLERKQILGSIAVKSVDSLQTLQTFLTQQLHWYRYVKLVS